MKRFATISWLSIGAVATVALTAFARSSREASSPRRGSPHAASITESLDCSDCHDQRSWGVRDGEQVQAGFDHARTGFPLTGRHRGAGCTQCHSSARPITRECSGCHEDAHRRSLGQSCDRCHSAVSWASVSGIAIHRSTRLPLNGMHVLAACSECHVRASDNVWRGLPADCYGCHAGDYQRTDIHPLHRGVPGDPTKPALPKNCAGCHRTIGWSPAFAPASFVFRSTAQPLRAFAHDAVFPLSFGKHRRAACGDCHVSEQAPRFVQCTGCHAHNPVRLAAQHSAGGPVFAGCLFCHPGGARR
jgi:hypothetical protein